MLSSLVNRTLSNLPQSTPCQLGTPMYLSGASLVAHMVKNLPVIWETWVQSLVREDPLEKEMDTAPVVLPGESHGQRKLVSYSLWGCKESDKTE